MPNVGPRTACIAAALLFLTAGSAARAFAWNIVSTKTFRGTVEACKQSYDLPRVHVLPLSVGEAPVVRCFNNGFETITPHTKNIGSCLIAIIEPGKKREQWDILPPAQRNVAKIVRRQYFCRFLGAGAVLGESDRVYKGGTKVFFNGEEPTNFKAKDPGCEAIFKELRNENENYQHLIGG
ncbi:MAG: hypothetical protein R6V39_05720 [Desulfovibrionales bacterium]